MPLNREWIEARIPHHGSMCLLDEVIDWSRERIRCRTSSHRAPDNPLRSHGGLGIASGVEYASQTMALHGALAGGAENTARVGLLAGIRDVRFGVRRLDDILSDLICEVTHLAGDGTMALYEFALIDGSRILLSGRASVVLNAGERLRR